MLTALLDALINFIEVLVGWLVDVAVVLEATPFSFAWPMVLVLLLQALLAALSGVVWWARGAVWPINCGYPETTTGRGPCHNDVLGEWSRCRIHRRRGWFRRTDAHVIADLRRWQTIDHDGRVVRREDPGSDRIGLLHYRGWARPPQDVRRLLPVVIEDYRYRLAQLRTSWRPPSKGLRRSRATSVALDDVIVASQLIAGLLLIGLAFVGAAGLLKSRAPQYEMSRAILEYAAVFFLYFAVVTFKNGVVGRRQGNGKVVPVPDWMQRSWMEAGSTFGVMVLLHSPASLLWWSSTPSLWLPLRSMSGPGCASGHHEPRAGIWAAGCQRSSSTASPTVRPPTFGTTIRIARSRHRRA